MPDIPDRIGFGVVPEFFFRGAILTEEEAEDTFCSNGLAE
jgi:hypothetical protein